MIAASITSADVKREAAAAGFDLCGIAPAANHVELAVPPRVARSRIRRRHAVPARPRSSAGPTSGASCPSARSVISLGTVYNTARPYSSESVSRRSRGHRAIRLGRRLPHRPRASPRRAGRRRFARRPGEGFEARRYVDTGPVQERVYAQYAGLGWIGKNTCLINPELGSWIFLSEIITNLELEPDEPVFDQCGTCTLCLASCPTGALVEPGVLDSTRCLSYLTIEIKGAIPEEYREAIGAHAYGCDICQDVCPYNQLPTTAVSSDPAWQPRAGLDGPRLLDLWPRIGRRAAGAAERQRDEAGRRAPAAAEPGGGDWQQRRGRRRRRRSSRTTRRRVTIRSSRNTSPGRWGSSMAEHVE